MVAVDGAQDQDVVAPVPALNRFGVQVGRRLVSKARKRMTRWPIPLEFDSPLTGLRTEGCALLPRMFSPAALRELVEVAEHAATADDTPHVVAEVGGPQIESTRRQDLGDDEQEVLDRFWRHPTVLALLSAAERRHLDLDALHCTVQRLVTDGADADGTPLIRSDVAHPTHAMWLYLSDVSEEDGPLVYYPGSQRLTARQLRGMYAGNAAGASDWRVVSEDEIAARKLEPRVFTSPKGTAVLVSTFGYHGWLPPAPSSERLVLHVEVARPGPTDAVDV